MDPRSLAQCASTLILAVSGGFYGFKLMRKRNYLLGLEWWLVGISAANAVVFFATNSPIAFEISHFFDAFTRGFGFPVIAVVGMMAVTHGFKPSIGVDIGLFVGGFLGAILLVTAKFFSGPLPYFYLVMWALFSIYLMFFIRKLWLVGEKIQAFSVTVAMVTCAIIAGIYDFYKIPGEDTNIIMNFYFLAMIAWAFALFAFYHGYCALERANLNRLGAQ